MAATAASAALPPAESASRPASAARGSSATTPPRNPATKPGWPSTGPVGPPKKFCLRVEQPLSTRLPATAIAASRRPPAIQVGVGIQANSLRRGRIKPRPEARVNAALRAA